MGSQQTEKNQKLLANSLSAFCIAIDPQTAAFGPYVYVRRPLRKYCVAYQQKKKYFRPMKQQQQMEGGGGWVRATHITSQSLMLPAQKCFTLG